MNAKALFVDGPARGEVREVTGHRAQVLVRSLLAPEPRELVYHIHHFVILGRTLRIASLELDAANIPPFGLLDLVLSDKAKEAVA